MIALHETAEGTTFAVKVQPRARRNAIVGEIGGALKIALTAPPLDGRATHACIEFLADVLDLPRSAVTIVSGQSNRKKIVRVSGTTPDYLRHKLERSK